MHSADIPKPAAIVSEHRARVAFVHAPDPVYSEMQNNGVLFMPVWAYTLAAHIKDLKVNPQAAVNDWYFFSTAPVGDGFIDNLLLARLLKKAGYEGFLAMELDFLHPDYNEDEDAAVAQSVTVLRQIAAAAEAD